VFLLWLAAMGEQDRGVNRQSAVESGLQSIAGWAVVASLGFRTVTSIGGPRLLAHSQAHVKAKCCWSPQVSAQLFLEQLVMLAQCQPPFDCLGMHCGPRSPRASTNAMLFACSKSHCPCIHDSDSLTQSGFCLHCSKQLHASVKANGGFEHRN
jgi:hypothetical protein